MQRNLVSSLLAGSGATLVHAALMAIKHRAGILPDFEPYEDVQRLLSSAIGFVPQPPWTWLLSYINGAVILGFVFGKLFVHLPGRGAVAKGAAFGFAAWLVMGLAFFPLAGRGIFARELGHQGLPAALMLAMLTIYSVVMSLLYARLVNTPRPTL
ncbi:MAG: DUF6789 family protein [Burkholderiales bacterium]